MKILSILLIGVTCLYASYTVENKTITVGYCDGNPAEKLALEKTISQLGFKAYESPTGTAADFAAHKCQVVFNYNNSESVSNWQNEMMSYGRGYIQCSNTGWKLFPCFRCAIDNGAEVTVTSIDKSSDLTSFPNSVPGMWSFAHGMAAYSIPGHDYLATCTDELLPTLGSTAIIETSTSEVPTVRCSNHFPKALTVKKVGPGQGVFYAWCNYGDLETSNDIRLTENAIIFAAQPPKAEAGGPYEAPPGTVVHFDASKSNDNVAIVLYEWDFDGDGKFDFEDSKPFADHTYEKPYAGPVVLRCTDNLGSKSRNFTKVTISLTPTKNEAQTSTLGTIKAGFEK
jgi:hypothetical protein